MNLLEKAKALVDSTVYIWQRTKAENQDWNYIVDLVIDAAERQDGDLIIENFKELILKGKYPLQSKDLESLQLYQLCCESSSERRAGAENYTSHRERQYFKQLGEAFAQRIKWQTEQVEN